MSKIAQITVIAAAAVAVVEAEERCFKMHVELTQARCGAGLPAAPVYPCPNDAPDEVRIAFAAWSAAADAETFARRAMEKAVKAYRESKQEARPDAAE